MPALLWGVAFANIVRGVPIDADKEFTGNLFTLLNPFGLLGGLVTLLLFLTHGAMFVALKTDGEIRHRARGAGVRIGLVAAVLAVVVPGLDAGRRPAPPARRSLFVFAALALVGGLRRGDGGREGWAFIGTFVTIALAVAGLFVALFPDVMPSTHDRGVLADDHERRRHGVHAEGDDLGRGDLHAGRAGLPGLDLLGLPPADRGAPHPATHRPQARVVRPPDPLVRRQLRAGPRGRWPCVVGAGVVGGPADRRPGVGGRRAGGAAVTAAGDGGWHARPRWRGRCSCCCAAGRRTWATLAAARAAGRVVRSLRRRLLDAVRRSDDRRPPDRRARRAGHPRGRRRRALPDPLPAGAGAGRVLPLVTLVAIAGPDLLSRR